MTIHKEVDTIPYLALWELTWKHVEMKVYTATTSKMRNETTLSIRMPCRILTHILVAQQIEEQSPFQNRQPPTTHNTGITTNPSI
jgi:hypothetical protein